MKKTKKHQFTHTDPELNATQTVVETETGEKIVKKEDNVPKFVYRDLKRTTYIISAFIILLLALYAVQIKTNWLAPVLHFFGI